MSLALAALTRRFRVPTRPFAVRTEDGVDIAGTVLGEASRAVVFCHGFMGWHRKGRLVRFVERLAVDHSVYVFDFRGHGASGGASTFGDLEILDLDAVVRLAREEGRERVVTVGGSMGGIAAVRHAALLRGVDAVVAISTPAGWDGHPSPAVRRLASLTTTSRGRRVARALGVRVSDRWTDPAAPEDVAAAVSPTPLLVVHGRDDHYFDEEQAWRLYRAARPPRRLLLASRFGHAEDGYTPAFATLLSREIARSLGTVAPAPRLTERAESRQAVARDSS